MTDTIIPAPSLHTINYWTENTDTQKRIGPFRMRASAEWVLYCRNISENHEDINSPYIIVQTKAYT